MWKMKRMGTSKPKNWLLVVISTLALSASLEQVLGLPTDTDVENSWPNFNKRNIAALARDGYLKSQLNNYKRSISTLAKNGQLPTFSSPYDETDSHENEEESHEKRNLASIARLRSYSAMKRNIQALARDGYRVGRQTNQQNDKRNMAALARNGYLHKRGDYNADEYYYPFYQNPIPPLSEMDRPLDYNELYDYQQSVNPDMFPPLAQVYKRSLPIYGPNDDYQEMYENPNYIHGVLLKRGSIGLPVHGLFRTTYIDSNGRTKRYILSLPDPVDRNNLQWPENNDTENEDKRSVDEDIDDGRENFEKRHIGSLARLGLLPSFRFSGSRYSRSGRARLLLPSHELYRKHSFDENFGIRQYIPDTEIESDSDDADVPPQAVSAHSHPTGRILNRPLSNELPNHFISKDHPTDALRDYFDALNKNHWQSDTKETPKFYRFRSLKVPYHYPGKRYLLLPAVDNIMLRKTYPNSSLPSRRKNQ